RASYCCTARAHDRGRGRRVAIRADVLDAAVWAHLADLLDNPEFLKTEIERMRANDPTETDLAVIDRSLVQVARTLDNLSKSLSAVQTEEARAILGQHLDKAAAQRQQLLKERERIVDRRRGWLDAKHQFEDVQAWMAQLRGAIGTMPYHVKRKVLMALAARVVVHGKNHAPRWELNASIPLESAFVDTPIDWRFPSWSRTDRR
ncbi:MAG: hypothetical protein ACR2IK_18640, partial [Chloroflexota bacterium]